MNILRLSFLLCALAAGITPVPAQNMPLADTTENPGGPTPPPGSTVITSNELHMDQDVHTAVFTGNVVTTATNFKMTCQEMTVNFTKDNKVDIITAKGDVVIIQPGRVTHSGQAQYFHDEDKIVLTDSPVINDNGNIISAPTIIIYRTKQSLYTDGPTKTILQSGNGVGPTGSAPADSNAK
ncbi:MAG TPA: LptA/OstA family protein [Candidatus Methylacidiphilales bacterium]|nr:LptA/OstA family protein [Candidatus Methylacidiphilales bacterium]